jgi:hypothetical protein
VDFYRSSLDILDDAVERLEALRPPPGQTDSFEVAMRAFAVHWGGFLEDAAVAAQGPDEAAYRTIVASPPGPDATTYRRVFAELGLDECLSLGFGPAAGK